ncbi:A/G-specific adenine glycosylase [Candidatus Saccharibacteria bacterium]|nr:A/G-specific adenine glycosylase [Candidatus Saccharibacteria bacterium]
MNTIDFQAFIWQMGRELYRAMPWRDTTDPYFVLVSEFMLQQTQVERVVPKFNAFIKRFPDVFALASASLAEVLVLWSGLGYNRRAKYLHQAAKKIVTDFDGVVPSIQAELVSLPGIGPNTAAAVLAYSFNQPVVFVETNIRSVYFHHFFEDATSVNDHALRQVVRATLDETQPRQWYWALMDYGSYLKRQGSGRVAKSLHYKKQSPFKGSMREVRGQIIRLLTRGDTTEVVLRTQLEADNRFATALKDLIRDGLVERSRGQLHLTK